ncbi:MAG: PEP-CTERM sorting domain-containing protein [Burkholderiales bacterium]|nr:PEP-CTERM sorting domain-containing protein [Burkholderiales bacterium]
MISNRFFRGALLAAGLSAASGLASAQSIAPTFADDYTLISLGSIAGVPTSYGGLTFLDADTLLIGGAANGSSGAIYSASVTRDEDGFVTGFGTATLFATAPNIDGGLTIGPGGVLFYTGYPTNTIGQITAGSTAPDKVTTVTTNGVNSSMGSLIFVPAGYNGAGQLKVVSYNGGTWETLEYTADGNGTYDFGATSGEIFIGGGPEGVAYVPLGSVGFDNQSVLVSEYSTGNVVTYEIDANGDPILSTRQILVSGLGGAEGAAIDPVTGDFFFSTFGGGNQVVRVTGFTAPPVPEPETYALMGIGLALLGFMARRRKAA